MDAVIGRSLNKPTCRAGVRMKTASEEVTDMIFLTKWSSQTVCAGAELGVFDCLSRDGTRSANDVAAETGLDPRLLSPLGRSRRCAISTFHRLPPGATLAGVTAT